MRPILPCVGPEWGTGGPDSLKHHKNIGFLSNTGPDHKATKPAFSVGPSSARQRVEDGPFIDLKKRCQSWTPSD